MQTRHGKRQASIDWNYKKQHTEGLLQATGECDKVELLTA
jgi:hypothetical protein